MFGSIDFLGLVHWAVIQPEDDIAVGVKVGAGDRYRLIINVGQDSQRAGCVKSNSSDCRGIYIMLADSTLNSNTDTTPDISRGLLLQ